MTYDELLALLTPTLTESPWERIKEPNSVMKAFRAVVELHHPLYYRKGEIETKGAHCAVCLEAEAYDVWKVEYPCLTIQAIEKELA